MRAEIIAVGTEILMGQIVNTNSAYLAKELAVESISSFFQQVVGDNEGRLLESIALAASRSTLVLLTGGLGPTSDDITKQVLATYLDELLVENEEALQNIVLYHQRTQRAMSENNRRQALTFLNGKTLQNNFGLAVGCAIEKNGVTYIVLPGPPSELKPMFEQAVRPLLQQWKGVGNVTKSRFLRFFGIGESRLVTELEDIIEKQTNPTIAPYADSYEVMLRLTANGKNEEDCVQLLDELEQTIQYRVGDFFYGYGEHGSLAEVVVQQLAQQKKTIAVAESLTAGLFQSTIASIPGASAVLKGGVVAYQREIKEAILHVEKEIVETVGMVSEECAIAMAQSVRRQMKSDIGISFTGVAGPDSLENKEVGTVWIGLAYEEDTYALLLHLAKNRNGNRELAVQYGLNEIRKRVRTE